MPRFGFSSQLDAGSSSSGSSGGGRGVGWAVGGHRRGGTSLGEGQYTPNQQFSSPLAPALMTSPQNTSFGGVGRVGGVGSSKNVSGVPGSAGVRSGYSQLQSASGGQRRDGRSLNAAPSATSIMGKSVRLTCQSPDGLVMHSLSIDSRAGARNQMMHSPPSYGSDGRNCFCIVSNRLPLEHDEGANGHEKLAGEEIAERMIRKKRQREKMPSCIRTRLPQTLQDAFNLDPPVELLCVEGEGRDPHKSKSGEFDDCLPPQDEKELFSRVCLYTRKSVFLLQLAFNKNATESKASSSPISQAYSYMSSPPDSKDGHEKETVEGEVISVSEPFERYLIEASLSSTIIRVRMAPQKSATAATTHTTICPVDSLAMLTECREAGECTLLLHHANGRVTKPLAFRRELLADDGVNRQERIVDFCFAQSSSSLTALASMSILILKGSGDVLTASPIVFDGSLLPRSSLEHALNYLSAELQSLNRASAKWRQCITAQRYFLDVFPIRDKSNHFIRAGLNQRANHAANWPIKIQGPILFNTPSNPGPPAFVIESFGNSDMVGAVIAKHGENFDFAIMSPTCLLPRFAHESSNDSNEIEDDLYKLGAVVERVDLSGDENDQGRRGSGWSNDAIRTNETISLIQDGVVDSIVHCATSKHVSTISTNIVRVRSRLLQGKISPGDENRDTSRTTAWSCLSTATSKSAVTIQGIVVSDTNHELIARLSDGSLVPVNITESQYLHELEIFSSEQQERLLLTNGPGTSASEEAHRNMESSPPLHEAVEPLAKKIMGGLGGMCRIVGSDTAFEDVTPQVLAVAIDVKKRCDDEIVLPLLELKKIVQKRREALKSTIQSQRSQLEDLQKRVADLKSRSDLIRSKMEAAESNASILSERGKTVLQVSQDLLPTVTHAEFELFQFLERFLNKVDVWEGQAHRVISVLSARRDSMMESRVTFVGAGRGINLQETNHINHLLAAGETVLEQTRKELRRSEINLKKTVREAGLVAESENISSNIR